ncbi:MAG: phytoene desaturase family protein [Bacilli bacterium]
MGVAIIGGGIGGMISAAMLAKQGHEVTLFEKEDRLGGRLHYENITSSHKVDQGPTIVLLRETLVQTLRACGVKDNEYELLQLDVLYNVHFPDGQSYTKFSDYEQQIQYMKTHWSDDVNNWERWYSEMNERFTLGEREVLDKSFSSRFGAFRPAIARLLYKLQAWKSAAKSSADYFTSPHVQEAYAFQTLYIGGNPYTSPSVYSLVSYSEHAHGIWYVKGGYAQLVTLLETALQNVGVTIIKNRAIKRIIHTKNVAEGVMLDNEETHSFSSIIVNGDWGTTERLTGKEEYVFQKMTPSSGCVLMYLALDKVYRDRHVHEFWMSENSEMHMKQVFKTKEIPSSPSIYTFNPSVIDESLAPENESVLYVLIPVPSGEKIDWEKSKYWQEKQLERLEKMGFPSLRKHILKCNVRTPKDSLRDGLYAGGSFGIAPSLLQSAHFRPQVKSRTVKGVFQVGASIHPGGGVPIVMKGANLVVEAVLDYEKVGGFADGKVFNRSVQPL